MPDKEQIDEMMARVRRLELKARRLVRESFAGEYLSSFGGQGLDFDDYREYQHGDEVRFIDWNVTARMNQPFVRKFREEREMSVILAVDVSGSADYGSVRHSKREVSAEAAAVLGFSALGNGDKVGLLLFAGAPLLFLPAEKGTRHLLRMIREILAARPVDRGTSVADACNFLTRTLRRRSLVVLVSDFHPLPGEKALASLARQHETIALTVSDPAELKLPAAGRVVLIDPESDAETIINTSHPRVREIHTERMARHRQAMDSMLRKHGIDHATLQTDADPLHELHKLMKRRARKRSR
jgi:uncharacterized protein (DUF58 family)